MATVETAAAKRYAQAAFEIASEAGNLHDWADALDQIADFMSRQDVSRVLTNSRAGQDAKRRLIEAGLDLPALPMNLARLLVRKDRTSIAGGIAGAFRHLVEAREGIARVRAVTAVPLTDAETAALEARLTKETGRKVILETEVDPDLIGGVRVQIGDQLVDASTRARLAALRSNLVNAL
ncbi:MAG: ATP synthase F1 subunit delta [Dehalococcoidia bacterium]|nr:ATP synthase F1 subunit delta [Dehalococcoidia bacterium]